MPNIDPNNPGSDLSGNPAVPALNPDQGASAGDTDKTGDAIDTPKVDNLPVEPPKGDTGDVKPEVDKKAYEELETRLGQQGTELGEYRKFFQNIAPLLDKLDEAPELVQAIVDGKIDKSLAKAALEGKVDIKDIPAVQEAHDQVKTELGKEAYAKAKPEDINKEVEAKLDKFRREMEEKASLKSFQEYTQKFISDTSDFEEYAEKVDKWLDSHDVDDIEVAYYAVKGKLSEEAAKKAATVAAAEKAKDVVSNAAGGGQSSSGKIDASERVDELIAGRPNPNSFFN